MKVLLSIKPEYAESILAGEKKYEFRKMAFQKSDVKHVVIYATLPIGKVVGQFEIGEILSDSPGNLWAKTKNFAGISKILYEEYFQGRSRAFALSVVSPKRFRRPLDLEEILPSGVAPQSFCYLTNVARQK